MLLLRWRSKFMTQPKRIGIPASWVRWSVLALAAALLGIFLWTKMPLGHQQAQFPEVQITSRESLIHVGNNDSFAATQDGIQAAKLVLNFLEKKNPASAQAAIAIYDRIIPKENYGGEYTALQWFCQYLLAPEREQKAFLTDNYVKGFYNFFADNNFSRLKEYIKRKYELAQFQDTDPQAAQNRKAFLEDFILFNNPRREEWEKTSKIMSVIDLKPGMAIADVGSGPGYYTFRFSKRVGDKGKVFAVDTVQNHLNYVKQTAQTYGVKNVVTVNNDPGNTTKLDENSVDMAFMCSLYHNIYAQAKEKDRHEFVESMLKAIKKDGTLVVVDNALVPETELPYHGPYIAKELIIGQFKYYNLKLVAQHSFIPQRYVLIFKKI
jgi:ubiquinone/menaquinone biosynthesis C-methylase UbiE